MFAECSSLSSLFAINKWRLNNLIDISFIFKNCVSLSSIPKINLLKAADMTDFIKGCISLKLSIVLTDGEYINEEEINILDNNFYSLIEPNRKEIYKIVYDKILEQIKNSSIAYKCAWLARNNDNFVVDFFSENQKNQMLENQLYSDI